MGYEDEGLLSGIILNAIVVPVLVGVAYAVLPKQRYYKIFRPHRPEDPPTFFHFSGFGVLKSRFFSLNDPWLESTQSEEAIMFLMFQRSAALALGVIAFLSLTVLLPINVTDGYRKEFYDTTLTNSSDAEPYNEGVADWTTRNISPESSRLWAHFIVAVLGSWEVYVMVINTIYMMRRRKGNKVRLNQGSVALVTRVPDDFLGMLPGHLKEKLSHVFLPREVPPKMLDLMAKYKACVENLQHWYAYCEKKGITDYSGDEQLVVKKTLCCGKINAIEKARLELEKVEKKLRACIEELDGDDEMICIGEEQDLPPSSRKRLGVAFLVFKNPEDCTAFVLEMNPPAGKSRALDLPKSSKVWFAPPPKDIYWGNLQPGGLPEFLRGLVTFVVFTLLIISWSGIIAFFGSLDNLGEWIPGLEVILDANSFIRGVLTAYLPIIVLAVLNLLLPIFMRWWARTVERVDDKVKRERSVLVKMFWFSIMTACLLQAAMQGFTDSASWITSASLEQVLNMLAGVIAPSNGYFVLKVMMAALLGNFIRVIRIGELILGPIFEKMALTKREVEQAYEKAPFYFSIEYAFDLTIFGFGLIFSVNVPLIPFFAFVYYFFKFIVDRSTLIDCYEKSRKTDLRMIPSACQCALACLTISQLMGVTALALTKEHFAVAGVSAILPFLSVLLHVWVWKQEKFLLSADFIRSVTDGSLEYKKHVTLNMTGLLGGLICGETEIEACADSPKNGERYRSSEGSETDELCPLYPARKESSAVDPSIDYNHPCKRFAILDTSHEEMVKRQWWVRSGSAQEKNSAAPDEP